MINAIEVLEMAEQNLLDPDVPFYFSEWEGCTCGHIYLSSTGEFADSSTQVLKAPEESVYGATLIATAKALGWHGRRNGPFPAVRLAAKFISERTRDIASNRRGEARTEIDDVERQDALEIIRRALKALREQEEAARVAVLDRVREVVDSVGEGEKIYA